jgi:phospholipase C
LLLAHLSRIPRQFLSYRVGSLLFALLMVAGCSGTHLNMVNPATVSIVASPTSIAAGASSTLTVTAANAATVTVSGSDGSSYRVSSTGGTQAVSPAKTTTYTAVAAGVSGNVSAATTVTVTASTNPPPTVSMTASPTAIAPGSSSTLSVSATNATQVAITGSDGSSYTLPATGGTQPVSPTATTTYTATATGAGGSATATAAVTVKANPPPTVTISANPTAVAPGGSSILAITATQATQVTVKGSDGTSYNLSATGGTQAVSPAATTTYTATATGAGGSATATATVTVTANPPPTVTIIANPTGITPGGSSTLTVTASNATQVTISGNDGTSYTLTSSGGTQSVTPTKTTIYTATATGPGGTVQAMATVTVSSNPAPTVTILANPTAIVAGNSSTLTITATNATQVTVTGSDTTTYNLSTTGGTQAVTPSATTTYTATATGAGGNATAATTVTVTPVGSIQSIDHVIFLLQENHSFDNYFGMLNPYRIANHLNVGDDGVTYTVDGIDDKLTLPAIGNMDDEGTTFFPFKFTSTCIDDESSDWLSSYGDVERYNFLDTRPILMNGFVHTAEGFANYCATSGTCSGTFTDLVGKRAMGYYDQDFLNYYYYMASNFAISDRWFSPVASKSVPNRLATFTGGTTQGLVHDPGGNDHLPQLNIPNIFQELDQAKVTWKIYYTVTQGFCLDEDDCLAAGNSVYPAIHFSNLTYSYQYIYENPTGAACVAPTVSSKMAVGDTSNSYCVDSTHIAPIATYATDLANGTLPSFAFIEAGYGRNDEHPGSGQPILDGQAQVAKLVSQLMGSSAWKDSVFFVSYDEGGGPYDHVPPVPGHSNDFTSASMGAIPDISQIAVNPDSYVPCVPPNGGPATLHCDLDPTDPGANPADAAAVSGFSAQLGFRVPNMVISPFTRRHYVSHVPMDHTAIIKFVENRFIGSSAHLNPHDAAQPNLLDFFDFTNVPWATPPSPPTPASTSACTPASFGP